MCSAINHLFFHFLKYFPHTSCGSQNQFNISLNEVIKTIQKFNVTLHNWQKKYCPQGLQHLHHLGRLLQSFDVIYTKTSAISSEFITQVQVIHKA